MNVYLTFTNDGGDPDYEDFREELISVSLAKLRAISTGITTIEKKWKNGFYYPVFFRVETWTVDGETKIEDLTIQYDKAKGWYSTTEIYEFYAKPKE